MKEGETEKKIEWTLEAKEDGGNFGGWSTPDEGIKESPKTEEDANSCEASV